MAHPHWLTEWVLQESVTGNVGCQGRPPLLQTHDVNFDDQMLRYFGTRDLASVPPGALEAGIEHMQVNLGLTKDRAERFALWALLHMLGSAPDLDVAFKDEADREAARNFMDLMGQATEPPE